MFWGSKALLDIEHRMYPSSETMKFDIREDVKIKEEKAMMAKCHRKQYPHTQSQGKKPMHTKPPKKVMSEFECYNCSRKGHFARDYRSKSTKSTQPHRQQMLKPRSGRGYLMHDPDGTLDEDDEDEYEHMNLM